MAKQRTHNEYFRRISRTTCSCGRKHTEVWSWGEYVRASWRTVTHFCSGCFLDRVRPLLVGHAKNCGCTFNLVAYQGGPLPSWLALPDPQCGIASATEVANAIREFAAQRNH